MRASRRTRMCAWKKRRVVKTGMPTQRSSPLLFAIISDENDISDTSNSAKWSCRQNISEGWRVLATRSAPSTVTRPSSTGQVRGLDVKAMLNSSFMAGHSPRGAASIAICRPPSTRPSMLTVRPSWHVTGRSTMSVYALRLLLLAQFCAGVLAAPAPAQADEAIKIGVVKTLAVGPIFVAQERGYFAREGLAAELVLVDSAEPIAVAAASGAIDFGVTGLSAGFYSLAGQGVLRIIAAGNREMPGFKNAGYIVSNRAYDGGLTALDKLAGHSVAVTQVGGMLHYDLGLAIERYGLDAKTIRVLAVQSNTNMSTTIAGGQA